jgi:PIN domain nuclease of toxin-antitoxin system
VILLDTHIWFYFLTDDSNLRKQVKDRIESEPASVLLSPVSTWELLFLGRKKKLKLLPSAEKFVRDALESYPFKMAPLTHEIAILSETLKFKHADPADRFIAATAYAYSAKLATDDEGLTKLDWLETI